MRRSLGCLAIVFGLLLGPALVAPVAGSTAATTIRSASYTTPQGAVTWTVDHTAKIITVSVNLQIYAGCRHCGAAFNEFIEGRMESLAKDMSKRIRDVWNQHNHYYCYELIFEVNITVGRDSSHVDGDRVGIRVDNSPVNIRDFVYGLADKDKWNSNDPADRVEPINDPDHPSTWSERHNRRGHDEYAHEFGHVIGLHDAYEEVKDPTTGKVVKSVLRTGAPDDLMGNHNYPFLAQQTINRLVERSPVDRSKLKCSYRVVGSFQEANSYVACAGAVSPLITDTVEFTVTLTGDGASTVTDFKNSKTTFKALTTPVPVSTRAGGVLRVRVKSDPEILDATRGTVKLGPDHDPVKVVVAGVYTLGICEFYDRTGRRLSEGATFDTDVGTTFDTTKFVGGTQEGSSDLALGWTWVITSL